MRKALARLGRHTYTKDKSLREVSRGIGERDESLTMMGIGEVGSQGLAVGTGTTEVVMIEASTEQQKLKQRTPPRSRNQYVAWRGTVGQQSGGLLLHSR